MSKAVYVGTLEARSGKSIFVLGFMQLLLGKVPKVGYFRPVIDDLLPNEVDNHITTVLQHFELSQQPNQSYGLQKSEIARLYNSGKQHQILDEIIAKYKSLEAKNDFVLVEGSDFTDESNVIEMDLNIEIAKNLGLPVVLIGNKEGKSNEDFSSMIDVAVNTYSQRGIEVFGYS